MKAVILAGGFGTRFNEETQFRPKPMIEIGGKPILWHIMKIYAHYGIHDFVICAGYKGHMIKQYFADYYLHNSSVTFDLQKNSVTYHSSQAEPWRVSVIDTGADSLTGGRLGRVREFVGNETFCFTYGDGLSDVNIGKLIEFHRQQKRWATVTAVQPPGRFGAIEFGTQGAVTGFAEKPQGDGAWVNGGFFVLEPQVFDLLDGDQTIWEREPMERLAAQGQIAAYKHHDFWQPMDTLRDKQKLEELWSTGKAPWAYQEGHDGTEHELQQSDRTIQGRAPSGDSGNVERHGTAAKNARLDGPH